MNSRLLSAILCFALTTLPVTAQENRPAPEAASGIKPKSLVTADHQMVVAAEPLAAQAGREMLRQGGSAADAAIATELVLGLVEPQSSGLGGGAFLVYWDAQTRSLTTFDGRETAPAAATPNRFMQDGKPMPFETAVRSGLSVGVPGLMRTLEAVHKRYGKLPWATLFAPAIKLAEEGFPVSPRLAALLNASNAENFAAGARAIYFDENDRPRIAGEIRTNSAYAQTLRSIAEKGADAFYSGPIADAILKAVREVSSNPSDMTAADIAAYAVKERDPVCVDYRTRKICGMGPPSSGAMAVGAVLKLIEPFPEVQGSSTLMTTSALHIIAEAEKLTFADRNRYIADPDRISIPSGLLDDAYLSERRKLINLKRAIDKAEPGLPPGLEKKTFGKDFTKETPGTTHMSIVDKDGNALAMTATIENAFGSHLWAAGFLLNNELTDFSFVPIDESGAPVANAVGGGKRPRSSMAPTIVLDQEGNPEIVTGSPGGSQIILYVVKTLVGMIDWGLNAQQAAALPNFGSQIGPFMIEYSPYYVWPAFDLTAYGHVIGNTTMTSGIHTIQRKGGRLEGGADPRREGVALGD